MTHERAHNFVPASAGRFLPHEVPHDDAAVARARHEDLVVVLEAQDAALVAAEDGRRRSRREVPDPHRLVALQVLGERQIPGSKEAVGTSSERTEPEMILRSSNWTQ